MAMLQVYGTDICVVMSQDSWDRLSKRMQEYDEMTESILGPQSESTWVKTFILVPCQKDEGTMVPFLVDMESVKILGLFLKPYEEYLTIVHHKEVPVAHDVCLEGPELQRYMQDVPAGWC